MNRPGDMRVLMTADAVGGVWTYAVTLCRALAAARCKVALVTLGPRPSDAQRASLAPFDVELIETGLALEWQDPTGCDRTRAARDLSAIARRFGPDIVHLNSYREATIDWAAPAVVVAHSCVNSWARTCGSPEMMEAPEWRCYATAVAEGLRAASVWIAPTSSFHDEIIQLYNVDPGHVIWNGTDLAIDRASPKHPIVFSAGRVWDAAKNVHALLAAAPGLDWPLVVAGQTHAPERRDPGLQPSANARLCGELPHASTLAWMQRSAIFASAARYEPFGLGVLEAARCGCALILSDIGSFRELWNGAALFASGDIAEFAERINQVCRDEHLRIQLQSSARARSRRYSAAAMASAYRAIYDQLASRDPAPANDAARLSVLEAHA